jgi:hypothetical protein
MKKSLRVFSWSLLIAAAAGTLAGCVERKITIGSNPSGAIVLLNDQEIGRTPVTVPFTWYGDYSIRLRYEKNVGTPDEPVIQRYFLQTHKRAKAPVYQWIGIDLFAELLPVQFTDEQVWAFDIPEVVEPTNEELLERAHELKERLGEPVPLRPKPKTGATRPSTRPTTRPARPGPTTAPAPR